MPVRRKQNRHAEADQTQGKLEMDGKVDSKRLMRLRTEQNLSRRELASQAHVSLQTVARLELNRVVTTSNTLVKLAYFFGVPCGYLLGEDVTNTDEYGLNEELQGSIRRFLEKLPLDADKASDLLDEICIFVGRKGSLLATKEGMSEEEEVLGLWWSIASAYQEGEWDTVISRSQELINIAEKLGRPFLAAIGHAYKAKGLRNKGGIRFLKNAEKELNEKLKGRKFQSAFTCRMIGKMYSREELYEEALRQYKKAETLMSESSRRDALFVLERTKLFRNIATTHGWLARKAEQNNNESEKNNHIGEAEKYIALCENSIKDLEKQVKRPADIERMMLTKCIAIHLEDSGKLWPAKDKAEEALQRANELGEKHYAARVRMLLFHLYMRLKKKEEAVQHLGSLFPLRRYKTGHFRWHYEKLVKPHEREMLEYVQEQYALSNSAGR